MPIILGKRSSLPGACGVCASRAASFGVTNLKYPKMHEIMWICGSCVDREKWERIYSMSGSKLTEIEERCIGIAISECVGDFLMKFHLESISFHCSKSIKEWEDHFKKNGIFIDPAKKLLTEYQNQLKKYNE